MSLTASTVVALTAAEVGELCRRAGREMGLIRFAAAEAFPIPK